MRYGILGLGILVCGISSHTASAQDRKWMETHRWTGAGAKHTESFTIAAPMWRLWYAASGEGVLSVYIYEGDDLAAVAVNTAVPGSGESFFRSSGEHHLMINSVEMNWNIGIDELLVPVQTEHRSKASKGEAISLRTIRSWSGNGLMTTDAFTTNAPSWKIRYWNGEPYAFSIYVFQDGDLVSVAANTARQGSGESWVHQSGTFYLQVLGMGEWKVEILTK